MKIIKLLPLFIFLPFLLGCGSLMLDNIPPFRISSSIYYESPTSLETKIYIRYSITNYVEFDSIYFQKRKAKIETKTMRGLNYIYGEFKNSIQRNLVLDSNPIKELNNQFPEIRKFPFELKKDEALISYKIKGKLKYYKVTPVIRGESIQ